MQAAVSGQYFLEKGLAKFDSRVGIFLYWPRGVISLVGKVTAGLVESNSSLPPGL